MWAEFFPGRQLEREGLQFRINQHVEFADFWFVMGGFWREDSPSLVPKNRMIFLQTEVGTDLQHFLRPNIRRLLRRFAMSFGPLETRSIPWRQTHVFLPWRIHGLPSVSQGQTPRKRDFDFFRGLGALDKPEKISMILSSHSHLPGHRRRLRFAEDLMSVLGNTIEWFGHGVQPLEHKWDGLAPFQRTIILENNSFDYGMTEKLSDAFLCLTYPYYFGDPRATGLYPKNSFSSISGFDAYAAADFILNDLNSTPYEANLKNIVEAKNLYLDKYEVFSRVARIAKWFTELAPAGNKTLVKPFRSRDGSQYL